jgi:cyclic pyranopterin phosphate synthase
MLPIQDRFRRPLGSLRISVTDRCNLRCAYCMPEDDYVWLPRASILTFEETERLARLFVSLGAAKLRLTGGEPLLRQELPELVRRLAAIPGLQDLALTTNGLLLGKQAPALRLAGLGRVTVSLDTLRPERFRALTRADRLDEAVAGIAAARSAGLSLKLNSVIMRGVNDDELLELLAFARRERAEIRFIEYMDVGGATRWSAERVVSRREMLARIGAAEGQVRPAPDQDPRAPAERFVLPDGTAFGIIASTTEPFCRTCDRGRLTADGVWLLCLYAPDGINLKDRLRAGASDHEVADLIRRAWSERADRGAEDRAEVGQRAALYQIAPLRADPHKEMHTRGG